MACALGMNRSRGVSLRQHCRAVCAATPPVRKTRRTSRRSRAGAIARHKPRRAKRAAAKRLSDAVNAMIGAWEFSNADHDKICHFNFRADAVPGGYRLDIDKNCPNLFPSTKDMVAWAVDNYGDLRLLDAQRQRGGRTHRGRERHV